MEYENSIFISGKLITNPITDGDGFHFCDNRHYVIKKSVVDFSKCDLDDIDEAVGVTKGSSAEFIDCIFRGSGKLFLCGSGDSESKELENLEKVTLNHCILENFGRRGPEVQCGMVLNMNNCLIRNWGSSDRFNFSSEVPDRKFASWAHKYGTIYANNCIYWQDSFDYPISQAIVDIKNHIGQAVNDSGLISLLNPFTYLPGICRGLYSTDTGIVFNNKCWKNKWWIYLQDHVDSMDELDAIALLESFDRLIEELGNLYVHS